MPSCRVTNHTPQNLNICLKQVTALHFENGVKPGHTIKFKPGKVWFSLEAVIDDGTKASRYSVLKSAATIALLSLAVGAVAATAGAAMLPASVAAGGTAAGAYLAKGLTFSKGALIKNSGAIAKLSSFALPKAIDKMSAEMGGLSALQREVMSIVASPTLSKDVRHKSTGLLKQLFTAYSTDKEATKAKSHPDTASNSLQPKDGPANIHPPSYQKNQPFTPHPNVPTGTAQEAEMLSRELENGEWEDRVESTPVSTDSVLRVHGIYMSERRHFEIRVDQGGNLILWDATEGKLWGS